MAKIKSDSDSQSVVQNGQNGSLNPAAKQPLPAGTIRLGIIGGSGLYEMPGLTEVSERTLVTPFGKPSDNFICGRLAGTEVVFLPRHGRNHAILPGELNHHANIYGMKTLGVTHILSISAVGSLQEQFRPRDIVIVDQYVDRTRRADQSFFGNGLVAHIAFADPVCPELATLTEEAAIKAIADSEAPERKVFNGGTYLNMAGPAFSTKAESRLYQSWGMDVIGMTNMSEAKLAREAEICYVTMAMVTDYDCWHPEHDEVTVELVVANLTANSALAKAVVEKVAGAIGTLPGRCSCQQALAAALITPPEAVPLATRRKLAPIIDKYFNCTE